MADDLTSAMPPAADDQATVYTAGAAARASHDKSGRFVPRSVGPYTIIRLIGEGGMGSVYEAEQPHPHRTVALKVIKANVATPEMLRRFQREAEALARLQHPGIAHIFEAGEAETAFGRQPYFAMEFIEGVALVEFANRERLGVRQRLELMAKVCEAVHHAHQRGIIHRDLKPGNILVDQSGQPKILDFGIARITDSDANATRQTEVGQIIGTIAYMSPEQILAEPLEIDTRSDVYSLGVILYELLAGQMPYGSGRKQIHEVAQAITKEEPSQLGTVNRSYRGDIETIVAKALEKDKTRRYASAAGLAGDIRRFLNYEPIVARPATAGYQMRKFARRHRALVTAALVVAVVLVAGTFVSATEAVRARSAERAARDAEVKARNERDRATAAEAAATRARDRAVAAEQASTKERDRAVKAEGEARKERDRTLLEKQRADEEAATANAINDFLRKDLLAQASSTSQTGGKPDPDIKVRTVLDRAAQRMGDRFKGKPQVQAAIESTIGSTYGALGLYPESQKYLAESLDLYRRASGSEQPDALSAAESLGEIYRKAGKYAEAESLLSETAGKFQKTRGPADPHSLSSLHALATVYVAQGKFDKAEPLLLNILDRERAVLGPESANAVDTMDTLARVYFMQRKPAEAERLLLRVIEIRRRVSGPEHPWTIGAMNNLAVLYQNQFKYPEAESLYRTVLDVHRRSLGAGHPDTLNVMNNLGVLYVMQGKYPEAEPLFVKVLGEWRRQLGPEHPRTLALMNNIAALRLATGRFSDAEALYSQALEVERRVLGPVHPSTLDTMKSFADLYAAERKYPDAERLYTEALAGRRRELGPRHAETAATMTALGEFRLDQRRYAEAESLLRECLDIQRAATASDYRRFRTESALGASLAGQLRFADAEPLLLSGYEGLKQREKQLPAIARPKLKEAGERLVALYEAWGKPDAAASWREKLNVRQ